MFNRPGVFATPAEPVLSLEVQAKMPRTNPEEPIQFQVLVRHFLERFFNNEMASSDDGGKRRLIQVACAIGIPGFVMALYLYPMYHLPRGHRPYWAQVSDHYFYVVYSLVALGVVTIFEWDFFFPDLLDVFVLSTLPVKDHRLFRARIAAVALFVVGFLFDSNFLAPLVLPAATEPPNMARLLTAHVLAVALSGIFAAAFVLALQAMLLGILGGRAFSRVSLLLQGFSITALLVVLLLSPIEAGALRELMRAKNTAALCFPPFWFLGLYQRVLEGAGAPLIFGQLARIGCTATALAIALAMFCYPFAYSRKTRELVVGSGKANTHPWIVRPINKWLNAALLRSPIHRAIWNFISQTLLRVQRYRIFLVMYGGLGLALIAASTLRLRSLHGAVHIGVSSDGLRAAIPIVIFWTVAGLRMSFHSPTDHRGAWVFRITGGRPGLEQLMATKRWVLLWAVILSLGTLALMHAIAPNDFRAWQVNVVQVLVAVGLSLLLTDIFFLAVKTVPFTGTRPKPATHLVAVLIQYLGLFPVLIFITLGAEDLMQASMMRVAFATVMIAALHLGMELLHRKIVAEYSNQAELDEDQEEFPQTLGLRY